MATDLNLPKKCPCGSKLTFKKCCLPVIEGKTKAETPEQLMRSRYSAYATGHIDYINESNDEKTRADLDRGASEAWAKQATWIGLELIKTEGNTVEFKASYIIGSKVEILHETSTFIKTDDTWYYEDGDAHLHHYDIGRNDPCPCGSGKKFKKCCL